MTKPVIRAIETRYGGCRFRSRTEARWAVFFDALGIAWEYEREGYELPSGRYLPDFWLPQIQGNPGLVENEIGVWFEVKGVLPTDHEKRLGSELRIVTQHQVYIAIGQPFDPDFVPERAAAIQTEWPDWDGMHWWTWCPRCSRVGITLMGDTCDLLCGCNEGHGYGLRGRSDVIINAVNEARSARFGT